MAQWTETLEPYIKVTETVHTSALNPTAGEDLVIGAVLISDAGPAVPTLISSQSEFLSTYGSQDTSEDYLNSLNALYTGDDSTLPSTMWANAYRLAGSNTLLICRAAKANDIYYSKPLAESSLEEYILRDGELLKRQTDNLIKMVIDVELDEANTVGVGTNGFAMAVSGIGILGNLTTDDGAQYDYYVGSIPELVEQLNETSKFFSPSYTYYSDVKGTAGNEIEYDSDTTDASTIKSVVFHELYLGNLILDESAFDGNDTGLEYVVFCEADWSYDAETGVVEGSQNTIDLNDAAYSGFTAADYYASNVYNSCTELKLRIRRFNHDAVVSKTLTSTEIYESADSPYSVLTSVLDTFTSNGTKTPATSILERDFYEICVLDPSISDEAMCFNIGSISGRGDMTISELSDSLGMISVKLPDDMYDLGLNYYGYTADDYGVWTEMTEIPDDVSEAISVVDLASLYEIASSTLTHGDIAVLNDGTYYEYVANGLSQIYVDLTIDTDGGSSILNVSDADLKKALDQIVLDEVYVTEGFCDLGNTESSYQSYMANYAINDNYFYPISTVQSTNYMTIANSASKISQDSYKLYLNAPWDLDSGTLGWSTPMSPSVLYWEAVAKNKRNNMEFAAVFGQSNGVVQYVKPATEFNKKTRQLLLTKKINTVLWNNQTSAWNMNDNYTKQSTDTIMSDEGNSRLAIRISKAMPVLLKQFIGWKISSRLWASATSVLDYWFKTTILAMGVSVDDYRIQIDESNNPTEIQAANKMVVNVYVRYQRSLKYILVYHDIYDVGMDLV